MKKVNYVKLLLGAILIIISCTNKKPTTVFVAPSSKEIHDVVNTLVMTERLQDPKMDRKTFIMANLKKQKVNFEGRLGRYANFKDMIVGKGMFSKADSSFFVYQNSILPTFTMTETPFSLTAKGDLKSKKINEWYQRIITISIPIFSLDHNKAYFQVDLDWADSGHGETYFMVKENNKWRVKTKYQNWVA